MHIRSTSVSFLGTSTGLAIRVAFFVSRMNCASSSRLTSSPIALRLGSENRRNACFTGLVFGLMRRACYANSWYSWHVGWAPGKDFPFSTEESYEGSRLLLWEMGVHADCFLWVRWMYFMGDCVAVNVEVASVFLCLASACQQENTSVCRHGYFFEFLLGSKCVGDFVE